ncbi:MAG: hypothetical protein NE328_06910, partial [Lentisphaeraceae bacterium]|nr:hypothetical protein [Lentisphaeraceae bacterium]
YFDIDNGVYLAPSCPLASHFGFSSYNEDHVDYEFLNRSVKPSEFLNEVFKKYTEERFKHWNVTTVEKALTDCEKRIELINSILFIGNINQDDISKNKDKNLDEGFKLIYCGSYSSPN